MTNLGKNGTHTHPDPKHPRRNLCWTANQVRDKIQSEGGLQSAIDWGIHQVPVESDELRAILDFADYGARILGLAWDKIDELAENEEI